MTIVLTIQIQEFVTPPPILIDILIYVQVLDYI